MPRRIYTASNLGLGQSGVPFGGGIEQIGSGKGIGSGFRTFGPVTGGGGAAIMDPGQFGLVPQSAPAPTAAHLRINFDTIGQTIPRSYGHCRLPLRPIWAEGIVASGDETISPTQTFAGALCMPLDAAEDGVFFQIWDSDTLVQSEGGIVIPDGWSTENAALLAASLAAIEYYPGNEIQAPASRIVADKGPNLTNAFRGMRYVIVPFYPIQARPGGGSGGLPSLNFAFRRTNVPDEPEESSEAVEFLAGTS